jgi:hypothetical protein
VVLLAEHAQLPVVGTRGRNRLSLHHARCPVAVVPHP